MMDRCLACQSTHGTPAPNTTDDWYWQSVGLSGRRIGPFCSQTCVDAWMLWPEGAQLASIFGDAGQATATLQRIEDGCFVQDMPQPGDTLHVLDFKAGVLLDEGAPFATLPHSKCPKPTHNNRGYSEPNYCLDCGFAQPIGWREVVAR